MAKKKDDGEIVVSRVEQGHINVVLVGSTPLIINRMSEKAKHELLMPKGKKTAADKAANLKHDPIAEFRASPYMFSDEASPTLLGMPAAAPKKAIAAAAIDVPGSSNKAQIGRLTWVPGELLNVYGLPELFMSITRSADMNHTPDVRTRCIVPHWVIPATISFVTPMLNPTIVLNLLSAAGLYIGLGDWRLQKGAGNYGQFQVMSEAQAKKDDAVQRILSQGRAAQTGAMANPVAYDDETENLLQWFNVELKLRGKTFAVTA